MQKKTNAFNYKSHITGGCTVKNILKHIELLTLIGTNGISCTWIAMAEHKSVFFMTGASLKSF